LRNTLSDSISYPSYRPQESGWDVDVATPDGEAIQGKHGDEFDAEATRMAAVAKLFASEHALDVADEAIQVHGGGGYVSDHPVERFCRDARITKIYHWTSEIQKKIIAGELR
jgi:alkylation response protein AidB-like acyl-CoA dehydrogenase